jgi:site-specific DNA-methyltransferase (adenine-specific)
LADLKWAVSSLFKGCKWLVWFYRNKGNLGNDWGRSHESILHLRKSKDFIFNIDEVRIPYNEHTIKYPARKQAESSHFANGKKNDNEWIPNPLGAKPKDVLEIPTISNGAWEKTTHKTQKPVELLRKIILSSSNQDSTILDPFGGSGTTYAVAEAYKRNWLGTELENDYCSLIAKRLSDKSHIERILSCKDEKEAQKRRINLRGE